MQDLRVLFDPTADHGYRAHLADAEGTRLGVEVPFTPFLDDGNYEDLRWYLEDYMDLPDGSAIVPSGKHRSAASSRAAAGRSALRAPSNHYVFVTALPAPKARGPSASRRSGAT
jgi:hypothetical protein